MLQNIKSGVAAPCMHPSNWVQLDVFWIANNKTVWTPCADRGINDGGPGQAFPT
jgi:hypothetical protein